LTFRKKAAAAAAVVAVAAGAGLVGSDKICACGTPDIGDQTPPAVSVSFPAASAELTGTVVLTADAIDDKGVAGVQFKRAGSTNIGAEDTSSPYSVSLDTTALSNGSLSLTAVARDAAGNSTTSAAVVVTVDNASAETANVWVDTTGGTCTRSGSAVAYVDAAACSTFQLACAAATGGDEVGVQPGTYTPAIQRFITSDCSDGAGGDVNWNTSTYADLTRATDWVTFKCVGDRNAVMSSLSGFTIKANAHVIIDGGPDKCFYLRGSVSFGEGGDATATTKNLALYRVHQDGIRNWGAQNTLILDSEIGPSVKCGKEGSAFVTDFMECSSSEPYWESQWAAFGTPTSSCPTVVTACGGSSNATAMEPIIGVNTGQIVPTGSRMEGNWIHDQQTKGVVPWHPGCLLVYGFPNGTAANSFVYTRNLCERISVQQVQLEKGDGTTISNNWFGTPLGVPEQEGGSYTVEKPTQISFKMKTDLGGGNYWSPQNVTVAYNTFAGGSHVPWSASTNPITFTNVKFIGNLTLGTLSSVCSATGAGGGSPITYTGNYGAGCTAITGGTANVVDAAQGSDFCDESTHVDCQKLDLHLTGAAKAWEDAVAASAGGLDENVDGDGDTRSDPRTAGADER
jgi:hypothetical protein